MFWLRQRNLYRVSQRWAFWVSLLSFIGAAVSASPWVTAEHILIGEAGFQRACQSFHTADTVYTPAQQVRLDRVCPEHELQARYYGELSAYGGDYAAEPEDIPTDFEQMSARLADLSNWARVKNLLHRALLALKDHEHFQPHAQGKWLTYHNRSRRLADEARLSGDDDEALRVALIVNGFGDHFLQDAFSAGHIGTDRESTIPSLQKVYHDHFCCWGRFLGDGLGHTWFALGDGGLDKACNAQGKERVIAATAESVRDLLWHFVIGEGQPLYAKADELMALFPAQYANQAYKVIPAEFDPVLCASPDMPVIRLPQRYLKCSDPDFFDVYVRPQLGG